MTAILLSLYKIFTLCFHFVLRQYFKVQLNAGKIDKQTFTQRFCEYPTRLKNEITRMTHDKDVLHFHAASAGEFNSIKVLLKQITDSSKFILITTATKSGEQAFENYQHHNANIFCVTAPFDTPQAIEEFLSIWKPSAVILVESEIWPNLIMKASRTAVVSIISGRISKNSYRKWCIYKALLTRILSYCSFIGAGTKTDFQHYKTFFKGTVFTGNLKYDAEKLSVSPTQLETLHKSIGKRPVLVCASTHPGEEKILLNIYKDLLIHMPNLLMIIAPRHVNRAEEIYRLCFSQQLTSMLRFKDDTIHNHVPANAQIYIYNTMGELGIAFSLSKVVFLGGSLVKIGGHNIYEPAMFGCAVVTGKYYYNFADVVQDMSDANALIVVQNKDQLREELLTLLLHSNHTEKIAENAMEFFSHHKGAIDRTVELFLKHRII